MTMTTHSSPTVLLLVTLSFALIGILLLIFGRKLPHRGSWLVWVGCLLVLIGIGFEFGGFFQQEFQTKIWSAGWILSREEQGAIEVGVFQDIPAVILCAISVLITGGLLLNGGLAGGFNERAFAAMALSTAGVCLALVSLTPWLAFAGLLLVVFGAVISLGSHWGIDGEARIVARFLWERSWSLLIAFFGACILASSNIPLVMSSLEPLHGHDSGFTSVWVGFVLMVGGLFIQLNPFPFLGWVVADSKLYPPLRLLLSQIFPAWVVFFLLLRFEPQLVNLGLFPGFGWIALVSTFLATLSGLFQPNWRSGLSVWLVAGFSMASSLLAFSGRLPAISWLLGVSLGALSLSNVATALEGSCSSTQVNRQRALWMKSIAYLSAAAGTGMIGFVSASGGLSWITKAIETPGIAAVFLFVFFLFALLGWRMAWKICSLNSFSTASVKTILSSFVWLLLSFGVVWTGTASGGILPGLPDRITTSIFSLFSMGSTDLFEHGHDFFSASGLYWGALIAAIAAAYWSSGRKEDRWVRLTKVFPKLSSFLAHGYGVDHVVSRGSDGLIWFGNLAVHSIDRKIWSNWIPLGIGTGLRTVSNAFHRVDSLFSVGIGKTIKRMVEIPGKTLQLIQTGDLRWYLFLALSSGFALLAHYFKR